MDLRKSFFKKNARDAYWYCRFVAKKSKSKDKILEKIILRKPIYIYLYAKNILEGRWPEAEIELLKKPKSAYLYAVNVRKARWRAAEPIIRKSHFANKYARTFFGSKTWPAKPRKLKDPILL